MQRLQITPIAKGVHQIFFCRFLVHPRDEHNPTLDRSLRTRSAPTINRFKPPAVTTVPTTIDLGSASLHFPALRVVRWRNFLHLFLLAEVNIFLLGRHGIPKYSPM